MLARPRHDGPRWSGPSERQAFARARSADEVRELCERMCRVLVLGVLPALLERDCDTFGEALHEYNRFAGRMFAADQGGDYASPETEQLVRATRALGAAGTGQSSWGPTVFAVCANPEAADKVSGGLREQFPDLDMTITTANNTGAEVRATDEHG
ncbi:hypothetical protein [Fimbriiglobus ruber]|nr:hypothetical protein [Fimbriiglobus ruber]